MNNVKSVVFLFLLLVTGCGDSSLQILEKVASQLNQIETIKYDSRWMTEEEGTIILEDTTSLYIDLRNEGDLGIKYHFFDEQGEMIYNGKELTTLPY